MDVHSALPLSTTVSPVFQCYSPDYTFVRTEWLPAVGTDLLPEALDDMMRVSMSATAADPTRALSVA